MTEMYRILKDLRPNFKPTAILLDFKTLNLQIQTLHKKSLMASLFLGCHFHFSQKSFKKIIELGFKVQYSNDNVSSFDENT